MDCQINQNINSKILKIVFNEELFTHNSKYSVNGTEIGKNMGLSSLLRQKQLQKCYDTPSYFLLNSVSFKNWC